MICPVCKTEVPDDASVCPACRTDLSVTRVMPRLQGSWCPSCGALIPDGSDACPKCGTPLKVKSNVSEVAKRVPSLEDTQAHAPVSPESTNVMPRIESAIPAEPDPADEVYGREYLPRTRKFLFAAVASLVIVGGGILLITHPWNPTLTATRATTPADVSTAGFPGEVTHLKGQDSVTDTVTTVASADEQTYSELIDAYTELGQISKQADELESELDEVGISGSAEERAQGNEDAQTLSISISNLMTSISKIEVSTTGTYTEDRSNLVTLGNWLRNRIEAIASAWERSAASDDPSSNEDYILAPMLGNRSSDGSEAYVNLFSSNYADWMPEEK